MKILIAAPTYLPSRRANTMQVMKMAQAIQDLSHDVRILVPDTGSGQTMPWDEFSQHYGLNQKLDIFWLSAKPDLRSYDYGAKVIRHFREWGGEILYTRLPQAAAMGSMINIRTILEVHDLPTGKLGPLLFRLFIKGKGARRLVLITNALRQAIHQMVLPLPDSPFTLVAPDGVDLARYENLPSPHDARIQLHAVEVPQLPIQVFTIGYTGHLYEGRGIEVILNLAGLLPEFNFLLVGGDPHSVKRVEGSVEERGLQNVILTGFIANKNLPLYQAACDVLLMPYQHKVAASSGGDIAPYLSPMKLFEYLACGRVIISSDLTVIKEILHDQNAILLPPEDIHAWVNAVKNVSGDFLKRQALGERAKTDAEKYTWTARAKKILSLSA